MKMELRPYQQDCIQAIRKHFRTSNDSAVVSASTGSGKTIIFSDLIKGLNKRAPDFRTLILAHRKQILQQSYDKLITVAPELKRDVGIYSAGLNLRQMDKKITIAGIQSVHNRAFEFDKFGLIIVDEGHHFSEEERTTYKKFIDNCKEKNPELKVLIFTATPYRMKGGLIYGEDKMIKKLIYKIGTGELIDQGYLCHVTAKHAKASQDFSKVKMTGGEFNKLEVELILNKQKLVEETVKEIKELSFFVGREKILIFCCSIAHAELVRKTIGIDFCSITHSKMSKQDRQDNEWQFITGGEYGTEFMCNVGVLTEGWDCPKVDCIVLLTATASPGKYVQMVGRGLRNAPGKENCLVLDFAENIDRHGPIDRVEEIMEKKKREKISPKADCKMMKVCPECDTYLALAARECLECGYLFPERSFIHNHKAGSGAILASEIELQEKVVYNVCCNIHKKKDKPDSLKVTYYSKQFSYKNGIGNLDLTPVSEWICFQHTGYALKKARSWWHGRFASAPPEKIADINLREVEARLKEITQSISVVKKGKYFEIKKYSMDFEHEQQVRRG